MYTTTAQKGAIVKTPYSASKSSIAAKRTKCEVWTRVMGYHRPVSQFNKGKKSEHYERVHFSQRISEKSTFA